MRWLCFCLSVLWFVTACQSGDDADTGVAANADQMDPSSASQANESEPAVQPAALKDTEFSPHLTQYIKTLSSDAFAGRQPASPGEEKTVQFLRERFQAAGLQPGHGDRYFQEVPLVAITVTDHDPLVFQPADSAPASEPVILNYGEDMVTWTKRVTDTVAVQDSDVVFVGYGIVAPEYDWNDYADVDVRGKTVVILVNDPGFATGDDQLFRGNTMTYYGRWTYKFEEAARQGAAMAVLVHETDAAGYGFDVVQGSWTGPQFDLVQADKNRDRVAIEAWITHDAAEAVLRSGGADLAQLKARALQADFKAQPLPVNASARLVNALRESKSRNVIALLPGRERPEEYFIYTAHWDHLGDSAAPGTDAGTGTDHGADAGHQHSAAGDDTIYNGAQDNATGTAALLALAERFAAGPRPRRSIAFLAVTAEESGLLGSRYFAENPPFPMANIVAGVNMDALNVHGPMRDLVVVGYGSSELEPMVEQLAREQDRRVEPNPYPEKGFYYRSDHFNLAKQGVPMLYAKGGVDHFEKGEAYGRERNLEYVRERYHKPADEYDASWDLRGMSQDLYLFYRLGLKLSNSDDWPNWYEGNEFRAIRDQGRMAASP